MAATALIIGLGKSGLSAARYLARQGWTLAATDSRSAPPGAAEFSELAPNARLSLGGFDAALLEGVQLAVLSPGVSTAEPICQAARRQGIELVGDIELFARAAPAPIVGITGTNGKSTVTTLLGQMAERAGIRVRVGGNLGTPALELLSQTPGELYVLELSSYQLETAPSLRVKAATVLNVTADHLDRYAGMAEYAAAKANVFRHCGTAVINVEDDYVRAMPTPGARRVSFALATAADYRAERRAEQDWLRAPDGVLLAASELRIRGRHNLANALAAVALADACELPRTATLAALRDFAGLPHRAQWVRELRGVSYINDSKGTNVGATLAAVEGFAGPLRIIAGGDGKNQDFAPLAAAFRGKVRSAHLIGRDAPAIAKALSGICPTQQCADLPAAVSAAAQVAQSGDTVLLSPACASLDMFRDYTHRGEVFMRAVAELAP